MIAMIIWFGAQLLIAGSKPIEDWKVNEEVEA